MNTRGSPKPYSGHVSSQRASFFLSNLPIKYRLPLIIGGILFGIILISIWASYRSVKESALAVGRERLSSLTQQSANQSQQSLPLVLGRTFTAANEPAVRAFLQSPSATTRPGAVAVLQQFSPPQDPSSLQVELWNANPAAVLTLPDGSSPQPADLETEFKQCATEPFKAVGPIRALAHAFNLMVVELRDSQRELERKASLFDHTYDAVLVWDWNGPITFWIRGAERAYGIASVHALGKSPHELLRTELPGGVDSLIHSLEQDAEWEGELRRTTRETKPEGKGTGLGLAICRRIVEEHGGTIEIKSETGCGTTVRMLFRATSGAAAYLL